MWFIGIDKNHPVHVIENDIVSCSEFMELGTTKTYTIVTDLIYYRVTCFCQIYDAITTLHKIKDKKIYNHIFSDYETEINPENPKEVSLDIIDDLKLFEITDAKEYTGELFAPSQPVMLDVQIDLNDEEN